MLSILRIIGKPLHPILGLPGIIEPEESSFNLRSGLRYCNITTLVVMLLAGLVVCIMAFVERGGMMQTTSLQDVFGEAASKVFVAHEGPVLTTQLTIHESQVSVGIFFDSRHLMPTLVRKTNDPVVRDADRVAAWRLAFGFDCCWEAEAAGSYDIDDTARPCFSAQCLPSEIFDVCLGVHVRGGAFC